MSNLFELTKRRRRAQEFADRFREGATESEREFFDRYYQEPSASPILQRGELQRQLEEGDALRRSLMARGMNAMQAEDAAARAEQQRMDERDRLAQDIALTRGPGGIKGEGPGSYAEYTTRGTDTGGAAEFLRSQGMPVPARPDSLSLDDFAKQRAVEMQMAQSRARDAAATQAEGTVDASIEAAQLKVEEAKAKLPEVVANSQLQERAARNLDEQLQILLDPTTTPTQRVQAETTIDNVLRALGKGSRTSGAMGLGQNPAGFVDPAVEQAIQGAPQQMQGEGGTGFYLRPTQVESREFN
tara:strand:- start:20907 stop:21806 length:900 start_codon:yes stop_codon:yes gene_type:complete